MRRLALAIAAALAGAGQTIAAPRVLSLDQCADQYVLALAPRGEIVGLSKRALNPDSFERDRAAGQPELRATLESTLAAQPTVAVVYWTQDARLPLALRRRGVAVVQIDEANDFTGIRFNIVKGAGGLGEPAAGEALVARMDAELRQSQGAWGGARALYLTSYGFTGGAKTLVGATMAAAGLTTATAAPGYSPVSLESLVLDPPSALVLGFFQDLAAGRQRWTIAGNGYLKGLVAQRAIASLPGRMLGCPSWSAAAGSLTLAQARPAPHH